MQRLLKRIAEGRIDGVIVYKLDRLTRNSKDFHNLLELFEKHDVAFISSTESIDTKSPAGRLMTAIMVQFAQYDRELDVVRSIDFHLARAKKGLWTGGHAPLGYDIKDKTLVVNEKESALVNRVFKMYLEYQSAVRVANELNGLGFRRKLYRSEDGKTFGGKPFDMDSVLRILQRRVYLGFVQNTRSKQEFVGQHKPIVDVAIFDEVQNMLASRNHRGGEVHVASNKYGFLLKGLLTCGECGGAIVPTYVKKKGNRYLYYKCLAQKGGLPHKCPITPLGARKFESFVVENLAAIGWDRPFLERIVVKAQKLARESLTPMDKEQQMLAAQLKTIKGEAQQLLSLVKSGDTASEVVEELHRLEGVKKELTGKILKVEALASHGQKAVYDTEVIQGALQRFAVLINRIPVDHQVKVIRAIVSKINIYKNRVEIKVPEVSVGEIQKMLDEKLVLGGRVSPEEWGVKTNLKKNNRRIEAVVVEKNWRRFLDIVRNYFAQHPEVSL